MSKLPMPRIFSQEITDVQPTLLPEYRRLRSLARLCRDIKKNLDNAETKIIADTINSSDILDGLWAALPLWDTMFVTLDTEGALRDVPMRDVYRSLAADVTLDIGVAYDAYKVDSAALVTAIRGHATLFNPNGTEKQTIEDVNGQRSATVYSLNELDDLLAPIQACQAHFF